jgi:hypothetical protein
MTITGWRKSSFSGSNGDCLEVGSWRTASYSGYNGNCVEAGNWRTSSACASGECVEAGSCGHGIAIRDTELAPSSPVLFFDSEAWRQFLGCVKAGGATVALR